MIRMDLVVDSLFCLVKYYTSYNMILNMLLDLLPNI